MRHVLVWGLELLRLVGGRRLHPVVSQCPICGQMVRLHVNQAGRRHALEHARSLYEGSRFDVHYAVKAKCAGSGTVKVFHPHPSEPQRFKLPDPLREE